MSAAADVTPGVGPVALAVLLALATLSGLFLSRLFRAAHGQDYSPAAIPAAFPLIALALTSIFLTVQFSLPLSLGLLGALSVVRFRSPVKQPEEIAFLFVVIAASVTTAAYKLAFTGAVLGAAVCVAIVHRLLYARAAPRGGIVRITLPGCGSVDGSSPLASPRDRLSCPLESLSVGKTGTRLAWRFAGDPEPLLRELRREAERHAPAARIEVISNRELPL